MLFKKIISSGETGAESAALDVALRLNIPCAGIDSRGLLIDGNRLLQRYRPIEKPFSDKRTDRDGNLDHSDGTLVFTHGPLSDYLDYLHLYSLTNRRPFLHIDFNETTEKQASLRINLWAAEHLPVSVHVSGSKIKDDPAIYQAVYHTMYQTLALGRNEAQKPAKMASIKETMPKTLDKAIQILTDEIATKDKVRIANMTPTQVTILNIGLGRYIRNRFGLWSGNKALMVSCAREAGLEAIHEDQASAIIIKKFAEKLVESHKLRVVDQ